MALKKSELIVVAEELNDVLGLDPEINVKGKVKKLQQEIIEAGQLIDPVGDEFTDETWAVLEELGAASRPGEESGVQEEGVEDAPDAVEEQEEQEEEAGELVEDFKAAKKLVELKEVAEAWECFEKLDLDSYAGLQGPKKLRADMLECLPDEIREQLEPKPVGKGKVDKPAKAATGGPRPSSEEVKARNGLIESLIAAGKYTRADILDAVTKAYPNVNRSTVNTMLTDAKNPKYNRFSKLAVEDENKIMGFKG